ncbi:hypothetical protein FGE05_19760 [Pseudomonas sp. ICMP22404]|nr:hypothetical protein FGE05_19760 [Pseudomonas sp. ICMP22404]
MWERACSRWRTISQLIHGLIHRIREQARSHRNHVPFSRRALCASSLPWAVTPSCVGVNP